MKRIVMVLFLVLLAALPVGAQEAPQPPAGLDEAAAQLQGALDSAYAQGGGQAAAFRFDEVATDVASGDWSWDWNSIANQLVRLLFGQLHDNLTLLVQMIVLAVLAGILCNLQGTFAGRNVGEIGVLACYVIIAGIAVSAFSGIVEMGAYAIDRMVLFMQSLVPTLVTILATGGSVTTAATFSPTLLVTMQIVTLLAKSVFLPLIVVLTALSTVNNLTDRFHITKLVDFFRQLIKWGLGLLLTIFIAILSMQGLTSAMADGVAGKTVKYAVGNFVPMVGGVLAESVEAVMSSTSILRNAVGVTGILAIIAMCAGPALKLVAIIAVYKFAAGVAEPVTDKRITNLISDLSGNITLIFVIVLVVAVMFVISVAMLCMVGNLSVAVRS